MSLILEALNRADQERKEQNHIPSLQTVHGTAEPDKPSLRQRLHLERWLILAVVAYLGYDFLRGNGNEETVAVLQEPAVSQVHEADAPAPVAETPPVAVEVLEPDVEPGEAQQETSPDEGIVAAQERSSAPAVQSLYTEPRPAPVQPAPPASPPEQLPQEPAPATEDPAVPQAGRELAFNMVLEITDLDKSFRRQIPTLKYSNHQPADNPGNSRVVLNKTVYKEGDQVAPGLVLRQISKRGIVMEFQGTKFKLPAYNSWINFPDS